MLPPIVNRFIAGKTPSAAVRNTASAREDDVGTILNLLGEHYTDTEDAAHDTEEYCDLIPYLPDSHTCISVKPSQLGADIEFSLFTSNLDQILDTATENDVFVWVDMEDYGNSTEATIRAVEDRAKTGHANEIGVCLQANLKRTGEDIQRLSGSGAAIRLVKGAYEEPEEVAHQSDDAVDDAFRTHMNHLFSDFEGRFALGTHDPEMIATAQELAAEHDAQFEFQMLRGVREQRQRELAEDYSVWQYAPYGQRWPAYVWRRLREGRKNWRFILRALLSRG